jgi:hypothetical protein
MTMKLINVSGESREYKEKNIIYEFPFPSDSPTIVPKEVGEKLLVTGHFKEVIEKKKKEIQEEKENAI